MQAPTKRTKLKRLHEYGRYDRGTIYAILDAMPVAHVSYVLDGAPVVTPTLQWREGDRIYWHGSAASRMLETAKDMPVCVAVMLIDGLVLARSGFNHSVNYRSAMLFGNAEAVKEAAAKTKHLETFMERILPGRWPALRPMSTKELKATTILTIPIDEASAKVTSGMPKDDDEDYAFPVWAGIIPISLFVHAPESDPRNLPGLEVPEHAKSFNIG
jgi:nitroimidazol reductase NimA-like FMN-containing flavoprotein (pyridoxamine 5'-phosphate oxidase superfamily)